MPDRSGNNKIKSKDTYHRRWGSLLLLVVFASKTNFVFIAQDLNGLLELIVLRLPWHGRSYLVHASIMRRPQVDSTVIHGSHTSDSVDAFAGALDAEVIAVAADGVAATEKSSNRGGASTAAQVEDKLVAVGIRAARTEKYETGAGSIRHQQYNLQNKVTYQ